MLYGFLYGHIDRDVCHALYYAMGQLAFGYGGETCKEGISSSSTLFTRRFGQYLSYAVRVSFSVGIGASFGQLIFGRRGMDIIGRAYIISGRVGSTRILLGATRRVLCFIGVYHIHLMNGNFSTR